MSVGDYCTYFKTIMKRQWDPLSKVQLIDPSTTFPSPHPTRIIYSTGNNEPCHRNSSAAEACRLRPWINISAKSEDWGLIWEFISELECVVWTLVACPCSSDGESESSARIDRELNCIPMPIKMLFPSELQLLQLLRTDGGAGLLSAAPDGQYDDIRALAELVPLPNTESDGLLSQTGVAWTALHNTPFSADDVPEHEACRRSIKEDSYIRLFKIIISVTEGQKSPSKIQCLLPVRG